MMASSIGLWRRLIQGVFLRTHPSYLVLFVTVRCNCRCPTCFNWSNIWGDEGGKVELSVDEIRKVALNLKPLPQLLLSGGEPFLRTDIVDIVEAFYRLAGTRQITIPTNGTLSKRTEQSVEQILYTCPELFLSVNLSLDGIGSDQDRLRGYNGCFEKLCETYSRLVMLRKKFNKLSCNFITTIMKSNAEKIDGIVEYVKERFEANYHWLWFIRGDLPEKAQHEKDCSISELESLFKAHCENRQIVQGIPFGNSVTTSAYRVIYKILFETRNQKRRCFRCLAGRKMIVLTHDGNLFPCEPLWLEPSSLGDRKTEDYIMADIRDFDFNVKNALKSQKAVDVKREIGRGKCYCQYPCAVLNGVMYSPLMYPLLLQQIMRDFL